MTSLILIIALACASISAHLTRVNLSQSSVAQSLLVEHQRLSNFSYRLFKQLTDEIFFGSTANQADVRKKMKIIQQSLTTIRELELIQREALGKEATQGSVEDTDELEFIIEQIISEFQAVLKTSNVVSVFNDDKLRDLLEVNIDNEFREAIDAAVTRQSRVVAALNSRIETLNAAMFWFTIGLGIVSLSLVIYGCYWLFGQLYQPLVLIKNATDSIAGGEYRQPITAKLDDEFEQLAESINLLGARLQEHEDNETASRKALESEVEQRTAELTKLNLELTKLDARRRQFINDISHELRTPLTIIRGESQITLRMTSATEKDYRETLNAVLDQAIGLSRLVDDLLLLARSEMNRLHLDITQEPILPVLRSETDRWGRQVENASIQLQADDELQSVALRFDVGRIRQVLSILLDNAIKYSGSGAVILVSAVLQEDDVVIAIGDNGQGISGAEIEHIFERFVRFSKREEGVGLGLPIAKAIVEAHDGKISVRSTQGQGSTFRFTLPRFREDWQEDGDKALS